MGDIVNLRQARKRRVREDAARVAAGNRAKFGRTKAQRHSDEHDREKQARMLDGARLETYTKDEQ